ncbi:Bifunctional dehydrogenase and ferrochelatase [Malassezia vespertilionis]|uniref:precorrin-2 dehydrogenase n=1 Tax=Malassezia vespertilionis TaxID=2020962 RepID=A0A2N1JC45_9BASI|nr:Bifunctional dehydrogenase and ferrochelatase [Malassezia vespertilionis]PKI84124.1 Met8p [Malassezia vespertilionis]WFD06906.1 Bifunctional dehydrogenase and ferrochelatase [Malassezia vespertilionis]
MTLPALVPGGSLLLAWQLRNKHVLLVGGGEVAASRLVHAKNADAHLTVMAPRGGLCAEMQHRLATHAIDTYLDASFTQPSELVCKETGAYYDMVLVAIDDPGLSRQLCAWCRELRIPVNVADVPPECDFYFGSVLRRGPLQVLVSTGGKGPRIARLVRQRLEDALPPSVADAIDNVGVLRAKLREMAPLPAQSHARMTWMSDVCDTYTLEQLAALDDAQMARLLHGFASRTVPLHTSNGTLGTVHAYAAFVVGAAAMAAAIVCMSLVGKEDKGWIAL